MLIIKNSQKYATNPKIEVNVCRLGKGTFAREKIKKGEHILTFTGPMITFAQAVAKGDNQCNTLQIGADKYLDIEGYAKLINHSCEPNAGIKDDTILAAIREIRPGEEITFDYSTTIEEDYWTMKCICKSKKCRKNIGDFKNLPEGLKQKYINLGIVQRFISDQFRKEKNESLRA